MKNPDAQRQLDDLGFSQEMGRGHFRRVNWSFNKKLTLRGLYLANYATVVTCVTGQIWDVAVDCRLDSPGFGESHATLLGRDQRRQAVIPSGFAHGFFALEDSDVVCLQCGDDDVVTLKYDDPEVRVPWPLREYVVSEADKKGTSWAELKAVLPGLKLLGFK